MKLDDIRFKAVPADPICRGCLIEHAGVPACEAAAVVAIGRGLPDCTDGEPRGPRYIYVLDKGDPRQMDLFKEKSEAATGLQPAAASIKNHQTGKL